MTESEKLSHVLPLLGPLCVRLKRDSEDEIMVMIRQALITNLSLYQELNRPSAINLTPLFITMLLSALFEIYKTLGWPQEAVTSQNLDSRTQNQLFGQVLIVSIILPLIYAALSFSAATPEMQNVTVTNIDLNSFNTPLDLFLALRLEQVQLQQQVNSLHFETVLRVLSVGIAMFVSIPAGNHVLAQINERATYLVGAEVLPSATQHMMRLVDNVIKPIEDVLSDGEDVVEDQTVNRNSRFDANH